MFFQRAQSCLDGHLNDWKDTAEVSGYLGNRHRVVIKLQRTMWPIQNKISIHVDGHFKMAPGCCLLVIFRSTAS